MVDETGLDEPAGFFGLQIFIAQAVQIVYTIYTVYIDLLDTDLDRQAGLGIFPDIQHDAGPVRIILDPAVDLVEPVGKDTDLQDIPVEEPQAYEQRSGRVAVMAQAGDGEHFDGRLFDIFAVCFYQLFHILIVVRAEHIAAVGLDDTIERIVSFFVETFVVAGTIALAAAAGQDRADRLSCFAGQVLSVGKTDNARLDASQYDGRTGEFKAVFGRLEGVLFQSVFQALNGTGDKAPVVFGKAAAQSLDIIDQCPCGELGRDSLIEIQTGFIVIGFVAVQFVRLAGDDVFIPLQLDTVKIIAGVDDRVGLAVVIGQVASADFIDRQVHMPAVANDVREIHGKISFQVQKWA